VDASLTVGGAIYSLTTPARPDNYRDEFIQAGLLRGILLDWQQFFTNLYFPINDVNCP